MLYQERDQQEADAFISALCQWLEKQGCLTKGAPVADLACGAGRHARSFWKAGYDVTGLDLAPVSIAAAQEQVTAAQAPHLRFQVHDMRLPFGTEKYALITNLFTSFGYFQNLQENHDTLASISQALRPGGTTVIDYLNPAAILPTLPYRGVVQKQGMDFQVYKWADDAFIYKNIGFMAGDSWHQYDEQVQLLSTQWFRQALLQHKLSVLMVLGNYDLTTYQSTSPRQILVARKLG